MYQYDTLDQRLIDERVSEFREQVRRFKAGELSEEAFQQLRLRNGLYLQRHAYMLRVAIPYGLLSAEQLRMLAHLARAHDRGFGHFTTRQNIQFNWPKLDDVPLMLEKLARVQMHAIQTSGNVVRNVTSDQLAGVAGDEVEDPRSWCELLRQWSTLHPEFSWLPRKFKIAVTGAASDRAAIQLHDIGLRLRRSDAGDIGFQVFVGGGLGRMPVIGKLLRDFLPREQILTYVEAILRVYNRHGRRDNPRRARIKVLVNTLGLEAFREQVEAEWHRARANGMQQVQAEWQRIQQHFAPPASDSDAAEDTSLAQWFAADTRFANWVNTNCPAHKTPGYRIVVVSLKAPGVAPGDITADQMDALADLAARYSFGEIRATHDQNLVLAHVRQADLFPLWRALEKQKLATANIGTLTDLICCPGIDYCRLANAGSIDIAAQINARFDDAAQLRELGDVQLKISGCMNACGHHHVGHVGILGVEKNGAEWYQLTLGGSAADDASLGDRLGPAVPKEQVAEVVAAVLDVYLESRQEGERFLDTYRRLGIEPFKERAYAHHSQAADHSRPVAACG
ncbi:MAG: nitrite/sulfite reductase [Gammaproteobacteria bacterium]|nr:MAG: nitrite/sulfite reductase [Gammaproteobacteria bacterium]